MIDVPLVRKIVSLALEEDLLEGDITSNLTIPKELQGRATIYSKDSFYLCGIDLLPIIIDEFHSSITVQNLVKDGDKIELQNEIAKLSGNLRELLALERTMLNFLQRLSGITTNVRKISRNSHGLILLDTRKTTPGHRYLEKYAVRVGGAKNHRFHLGSLILVKNNHVDACEGDMDKTLSTVRAEKAPYMPFEVEVRNIKELQTALKYQPDVIMLDNMNDLEVGEAMKSISSQSHKPFIEVSGGITEERFVSLCKTGVNGVSMSALTRPTSVDISMSIEKEN